MTSAIFTILQPLFVGFLLGASVPYLFRKAFDPAKEHILAFSLVLASVTFVGWLFAIIAATAAVPQGYALYISGGLFAMGSMSGLGTAVMLQMSAAKRLMFRS